MGALMSLGRRLLLTLLLACFACRPPKGPAYSDHRVITEDEIDASNATTAYDVIARLRADFLRTRGPTSLLLPSRGEAVVFLNDQEYGAIDALRSVRAADVAEIRFFPGQEAVTKFGSRYVGGVIQLVQRSR